jgi:hypothetical protein
MKGLIALPQVSLAGVRLIQCLRESQSSQFSSQKKIGNVEVSVEVLENHVTVLVHPMASADQTIYLADQLVQFLETFEVSEWILLANPHCYSPDVLTVIRLNHGILHVMFTRLDPLPKLTIKDSLLCAIILLLRVIETPVIVLLFPGKQESHNALVNSPTGPSLNAIHSYTRYLSLDLPFLECSSTFVLQWIKQSNSDSMDHDTVQSLYI